MLNHDDPMPNIRSTPAGNYPDDEENRVGNGLTADTDDEAELENPEGKPDDENVRYVGTTPAEQMGEYDTDEADSKEAWSERKEVMAAEDPVD